MLQTLDGADARLPQSVPRSTDSTLASIDIKHSTTSKKRFLKRSLFLFELVRQAHKQLGGGPKYLAKIRNSNL